MKNKDKITTFLGEGTAFEGTLKFCGTLRIDGHFKGEISGEGTFIVGEAARIESRIRVSHILNRGEIRGSLVAEESIEIHAPGKVRGNVRTPSLVMDEGAMMEGNCKMRGPEEKNDTQINVIDSDQPDSVL